MPGFSGKLAAWVARLRMENDFLKVPHRNYEINNSLSPLAVLAHMGHAPDMQGQLAAAGPVQIACW